MCIYFHLCTMILGHNKIFKSKSMAIVNITFIQSWLKNIGGRAVGKSQIWDPVFVSSESFCQRKFPK